MALEFGTQAWLDAFVERVNRDEEFKAAAAGFEGRLMLNCVPAPEIHENLKNGLRVYIKSHQGKVSEGRILTPGEAQACDHEIEGTYVSWKQVLKGELDVKRAVIIKRTLTVTGKITRLMKHLKAVERIIRVINEMVDEGVFRFPDEQAG
jgi:putative sterol carrier protein